MVVVKIVDEGSHSLEYQRMQSAHGNKVHFVLSKQERDAWFANQIKEQEKQNHEHS